MIELNSRTIAELLGVPHSQLRRRIENQLNRHPKLLGPLFEKQATINDEGKAELCFLASPDGIEYLCAQMGKDGLRLRTQLDEIERAGKSRPIIMGPDGKWPSMNEPASL